MKRIIVIGGGPGGNVAALTAARHGGKVVLVEKDVIGGTCTNRGCIPTKFFLSRLDEAGAGGGEGTVDWSRLMSHKKALVRGLASSIEKSCRDAGVEILRGHGRLEGTNKVSVEGAAGGSTIVEGDSIILATGSAPACIPGLLPDGEMILTSTDALELQEPPRSMIIVGSGAVGAEFAYIFQRAGTEITVVEAMDRLFPSEDVEVHDLFSGIFGKMGVNIVTGDAVKAVEKRGGEGVRVILRSGKVLEAEKVLVGAGRKLLTDDIGLEKAGLSTEKGGAVHVDMELRTSVPHIFAVGDITGRLLLAHLATFQGVQAARRAAGKTSRHVPYHAVPWSIFTTPEIATVGTNETAAAGSGLDIVTSVVPWMENIKARIDRKTEGFVKLVAEKGSGRLAGGTIVGVHASDMIHIVAQAVDRGMTASEMCGMVFAHPGLAESIYEAAQKIAHDVGKT